MSLQQARKRSSRSDGRKGNTLIVSILLLSLLAALAAAQFAVTQKNVEASTYFLDYTDLHEYAESGISMALHDMKYNFTGSAGNIGTLSWTTANDAGRDGKIGTKDEGEGDGLPTAGEPNVAPVPVGPSGLGAGLTAYVAATAWPEVSRVVATARSLDAAATVSAYVRKTVTAVPKVGAVFVDPDVALDLKGNSFLIDGNAHTTDGTAGTGDSKPGIVTATGTPAGTNETLLLAQIPVKNYDQILGLGGTPSLDEAGGVEISDLFGDFKKIKTKTLASGTYTDSQMGTAGAMEVTYASGDIQLSGQGKGAGVLLVDGSVTITGQFDYQGIVIVLGDVRLTGGGAGVHIYGTLMVGESLTAIERDPNEVTVSGNAKLYYSEDALTAVEESFGTTYAVVYYDDL